MPWCIEAKKIITIVCRTVAYSEMGKYWGWSREKSIFLLSIGAKCMMSRLWRQHAIRWRHDISRQVEWLHEREQIAWVPSSTQVRTDKDISQAGLFFMRKNTVNGPSVFRCGNFQNIPPSVVKSQKTFKGFPLFSRSIQYSPSWLEFSMSRMCLHDRVGTSGWEPITAARDKEA